MSRWNDREHFLETLIGSILMIFAFIILAIGIALASIYSAIWSYAVLVVLIICAILVFLLGCNIYTTEITFDAVRDRLSDFQQSIKKSHPRHHTPKYYYTHVPLCRIPNNDIIAYFEYLCKKNNTSYENEYLDCKNSLTIEQKKMILGYVCTNYGIKPQTRLWDEYNDAFYEYTESPLYQVSFFDWEDKNNPSCIERTLNICFKIWMERDNLDAVSEFNEARKHLPLEYVKYLEKHVKFLTED